MASAEKECTLTNFRSHCFPSIQESSEEISENSDNGCRFRPLFQSSPQDNADPEKNGENDPSDLEEARRINFEKGYEDGSRDACNVAYQELKPFISQFSDSLDSCSELFNRTTDQYAQNIINLALAIANKILGGKLLPSTDGLKPAESDLEAFLKSNYRLDMQVNSREMEMLAELLDCECPQWKETSAIYITGGDGLQDGKPSLSTSNVSFDDLKAKISLPL